jgi:hypothetical protein
MNCNATATNVLLLYPSAVVSGELVPGPSFDEPTVMRLSWSPAQR